MNRSGNPNIYVSQSEKLEHKISNNVIFTTRKHRNCVLNYILPHIDIMRLKGHILEENRRIVDRFKEKQAKTRGQLGHHKYQKGDPIGFM